MIINTNISSLIALNNLRLINLGMTTSLERLSSGLRINHASDDPSGLAIATGMEAQISGTRMAVQNAEDTVSLIHTADGALGETQDILLRMRDLAVRAANEATLTTSDRQRLNNEFVSLVAEVDRKSQAVSFNGKTLFDGTFAAGKEAQIGPDNGSEHRLAISIPELDAEALGIDFPVSNVTLSNATDALAALDAVDGAIDTVSDVRSDLGIQERRLDHIVNDLNTYDINLSAAKSRIMDADMAEEISEYTRLQILQQVAMTVLAQANTSAQLVLQLLSA